MIQLEKITLGAARAASTVVMVQIIALYQHIGNLDTKSSKYAKKTMFTQTLHSPHYVCTTHLSRIASICRHAKISQ